MLIIHSFYFCFNYFSQTYNYIVTYTTQGNVFFILTYFLIKFDVLY